MAVDWGGTAQVITACAVGLGTLGGGVKFLWNKIEARFDEVEKELKHCRLREERSMRREGTQLIVIELLWQEVRTSNPASAVLDRAKKLLDDLKIAPAFPVEDLPGEFHALARRLDEKD